MVNVSLVYTRDVINFKKWKNNQFWQVTHRKLVFALFRMSDLWLNVTIVSYLLRFSCWVVKSPPTFFIKPKQIECDNTTFSCWQQTIRMQMKSIGNSRCECSEQMDLKFSLRKCFAILSQYILVYRFVRSLIHQFSLDYIVWDENTLNYAHKPQRTTELRNRYSCHMLTFDKRKQELSWDQANNQWDTSDIISTNFDTCSIHSHENCLLHPQWLARTQDNGNNNKNKIFREISE